MISQVLSKQSVISTGLFIFVSSQLSMRNITSSFSSSTISEEFLNFFVFPSEEFQLQKSV